MLYFIAYGLTASAQCDAYNVQVSATGFNCTTGQGEICIITSDLWNVPSGSNTCWEYTRLEISFPAADFIVTEQGDFVNIDPLNPVTTTWRNDNLFFTSDGSTSFCISGVVQSPGVEIEYRIIDPTQPTGPNNPITEGIITPDGIVTVGAPGTTTLLSDAIAQGQLLDFPDAFTMNQRVAIEGTLVIDLSDYGFVHNVQRSEIVMGEDAAIEVLAGNRLDLHDTDVYGCDDEWDAIRLKGPNAIVEARRAEISGANTAFDLYTGALFRAIGSTFRDNSIAINADKASVSGPAWTTNIELLGNNWVRNGFLNNSNTAIRLRQEQGDIDLVSTATYFIDNGNAIRSHGGDVALFFNLFSDNRNGLILTDSPNRDNNAVVNLCQFFDQRSFDIFSSQRSNVLVDNSLLSGANWAIRTRSKPGDNLRIEDCQEISSERQAIWGVFDNSRAEIFNNSFIESNRGDAISLNGLAGRSNVSVDQNAFITGNGTGLGSSSGIYLNDMTSARITANPLIIGAKSGIEVDGGSENIIVFNPDINGNQSGIHLESSPMSFLNCNTMYGDRGLEVINDNPGATIRTQNLIGSELGLAYGSPSNSFANTGDQVNQGNLFDMSSPSTPQAVNYSALPVVNRNLYLVGFGNVQGDEHFPYFEASIPDWFDISSGLDQSCVLNDIGFDRVLALRKAIDSDKDILDIVDSLFSCEVLFDVEYNLVRHLLEYDDLKDSNLSREDEAILTKLARKESGQLATLVYEVDKAVALPESTAAEVDRLGDRVNQLTKGVEEVVKRSEATTDVAVIDSMQTAYFSQLMLDIRAVMDSLSTVKKEYRERSAERLKELEKALEETLVSCLAAKYLKEMVVLDVKARRQDLSDADKNYIASVANLCSQQYGKGVFRARSLRALYDETDYSYDDECIRTTKRSSVSSQGDLAYSVYPNPASDQITIQITGEPSSDAEPQLWTVRDAAGQVVASKVWSVKDRQTTLDIGHLPSGIYHLSEATTKLGSRSFIKVE